MEHMPFQIHVDGSNGPEMLTVLEKAISSTIHQFAVASEETELQGKTGWQVELILTEANWKQTDASIRTGPILPCFFVEEIGEQILLQLKSQE